MPDDPAKTPADDNDSEDAPLSPEEMMGRILQPQSEAAETPPPEDFLTDPAEAKKQPPAPPEDTDMTAAREESRAPEAMPPPPPRPQLDPRIREVAERFLQMSNQAATLTDMLNNEEITFEEYQRLLYEKMVQDEAGNWWMIDAENEQWYRHDAADNQWVVGYPAALAQWEQFRQAQQPRPRGEEGGMATETVYELPPAYLEPTEPGTGAPIVDGPRCRNRQKAADQRRSLHHSQHRGFLQRIT